MGAHLRLVDGVYTFASDKYPTCPPGKVPLSVKDTEAQDLLWEYARRHRSIDSEFSDDLEVALKNAGFDPKNVSWVSTPRGDGNSLKKTLANFGMIVLTKDEYDKLLDNHTPKRDT